MRVPTAIRSINEGFWSCWGAVLSNERTREALLRRAAFYPDSRGEDFHGEVGLEEEEVCLGRKRASKGLEAKKKKIKDTSRE